MSYTGTSIALQLGFAKLSVVLPVYQGGRAGLENVHAAVLSGERKE